LALTLPYAVSIGHPTHRPMVLGCYLAPALHARRSRVAADPLADSDTVRHGRRDRLPPGVIRRRTLWSDERGMLRQTLHWMMPAWEVWHREKGRARA
jgi:hypothetical protein